MGSKHFASNPSNVLAASIVFFATLGVFWFSPVHQVTDSHYSMLLSQSLIEHRSFSLNHYNLPRLTPEYHDHTWKNGHIHQLELVGDRFYYYMPPGSSILSIPYVFLLNQLGISARNSDGTYNPRGEMWIETSLSAILMAGLAVVFFFTSRLLLPIRWSLVIALGATLGTQVWSTVSRALWADTWGLFILGFVVYMLLASEVKRYPINSVLLATLLSWMYFVRPTNAVVILAVTVYLFASNRRLFFRYAITGALWAAAFVFYSWTHYHKVLPTYFTLNRRLTFDHFLTAVAGNLISPSRGLLIYVPVLLFVAFILIRYRKWVNRPGLVALAISNILLILFIVSTFDPWWAGASFGPRYTAPIVPWAVLLTVLGVDAILHSAPATSRLGLKTTLLFGGLLLVLSVSINALGALSYRTWNWNAQGDIDHDPTKVWDLNYPQLLAPFKRPPLPLEFPPAPARLDLSSAESQQFLGYGWSGAEKGFRWTDGDEVAFIFAVADPADTLLTISVTPFLVPGRLHVQRAELILNGHSLTRLELSRDGPAVYEVNLPRSVLSQKNVLVFRLPDAASPSQFQINADERRLALAVHWISFSRSIQGSPPPAKP